MGVIPLEGTEEAPQLAEDKAVLRCCCLMMVIWSVVISAKYQDAGPQVSWELYQQFGN